jgi:hypothetical protein
MVMRKSSFGLRFSRPKTEEELNRIIEMGVSVMKETVAAYKRVSVSPEFYEIERLRSLLKH